MKTLPFIIGDHLDSYDVVKAFLEEVLQADDPELIRSALEDALAGPYLSKKPEAKSQITFSAQN